MSDSSRRQGRAGWAAVFMLAVLTCASPSPAAADASGDARGGSLVATVPVTAGLHYSGAMHLGPLRRMGPPLSPTARAAVLVFVVVIAGAMALRAYRRRTHSPDLSRAMPAVTDSRLVRVMTVSLALDESARELLTSGLTELEARAQRESSAAGGMLLPDVLALLLRLERGWTHVGIESTEPTIAAVARASFLRVSHQMRARSPRPIGLEPSAFDDEGPGLTVVTLALAHRSAQLDLSVDDAPKVRALLTTLGELAPDQMVSFEWSASSEPERRGDVEARYPGMVRLEERGHAVR